MPELTPNQKAYIDALLRERAASARRGDEDHVRQVEEELERAGYKRKKSKPKPVETVVTEAEEKAVPPRPRGRRKPPGGTKVQRT